MNLHKCKSVYKKKIFSRLSPFNHATKIVKSKIDMEYGSI